MSQTETKLWGTGGRVQEIIGLENAAKLLREFVKKRPDGRRYCRVSVPRTPKITVDCKLALVIGFDNAMRLSYEFGGETIELPRNRHIIIEQRNQLIAKMSQFYKPDEIAEVMSMTPRTVRDIQKTYLDEREDHADHQ